MRTRRRLLATLIMGLLIFAARGGAAPVTPGTCEAHAEFHDLDFWAGDWDVYDSASNEKVGTSLIRKILKGCALSVDWRDSEDGSEIQEVFFYETARSTWHQVWISDAGPTKERQSTGEHAKGSWRFIGEVRQLDGRTHLDRSTVTALPAGRVHQVIDVSYDGGETWRKTFDGEYRPGKRSGSAATANP
jgi:hypothetical protein